MAFCNNINQENRHIRGVHYLEYARVFNNKAPSKVRWIYGMNCIVFVCCFVADRSSIAQ